MGNIVSWELKALVGFGFTTLWEKRESVIGLLEK